MHVKDDKCPKSEIPFWPNMLGGLLFLGVLYFIVKNATALQMRAEDLSAFLNVNISAPVWITFALMLVCAVPMLAYDIIKVVAKKKRLEPSEQNGGIRSHRIFIKMIGLIATYSALGFVYWLLPEYGSWYDRFWQMLWIVVPLCLIVAPFYVAYTDRRMKNPEDGYWHMGLLVLSIWSTDAREKICKVTLAEHGRSWIIKGFFMALMAIFLLDDIGLFLAKENASVPEEFNQIYDLLFIVLYTMDVVFAAVGYVLTLKLFDADIRSSEPSLLGWVVCIMCYPPLWTGVFMRSYFTYDDGGYWGMWLKDTPYLYVSWGLAIVVCIVVYVLATVSLGYRFSNMTYRGLTTTGVYRLTKHPAYVSKNISWWLISIPFITNVDGASVLRNCLMLLGVNFIYYMRAKTEERHLSHYPEYVAYAEWIDRNGIFRWVPWILPFTRYSANVAKSYTPPWWKKLRQKYSHDA